ncbi:conserved hypothetical protein, partial [Ricinus communis]
AGVAPGRHAMGGHQFGVQRGQVLLNGKIGEARHRADDLGQVGLAREVAPDQRAHQQVAQPAHGARQRQAAV